MKTDTERGIERAVNDIFSPPKRRYRITAISVRPSGEAVWVVWDNLARRAISGALSKENALSLAGRLENEPEPAE